MDQNVLKGKWKQIKGEVKKKWGKMTDDELDVIDGQKDKIIGKIQETYGRKKDDAAKNYRMF